MTGRLTPKTMALGKLVKTPFRIPLNQRPWSWPAPKAVQVLSDLFDAHDRLHATDRHDRWAKRDSASDPLPHFFGAFVLTAPDDEGRAEVVDGQQRLITVSMIAASLRAHADALGSILPAELAHEADPLAHALRAWYDAAGATGRYTPRLNLDPEYTDFYEGYIAKPPNAAARDAFFAQNYDPAEVREEQPVILRLKRAFDTLDQQIADRLLAQRDAAARLTWIQTVHDTLRDGFETLRVQVGDATYGFKVFRSLNARGTQLTAADNIKNELFDRSPRSDHPAIATAWNGMVRHAYGRDATRFLRLRQLAEHGETPARRLYELVVERELAADVRQLTVVRGWQADAKLMRVVTGHEHHPGVDADTEAVLKSLWILGAKNPWSLLLAAAKQYLVGQAQTAEFGEIAALARNFTFRTLTVAGTRDTQKLDKHLAAAAAALRAGDGPAGVRRVFQLASSDADFARAFQTWAEPRRPAVAYWALEQIERFLGSDQGLIPAPRAGAGGNNLEHILPLHFEHQDQSRANEWSDWRRPGERDGNQWHRAYKYRVGNLLILEANYNRYLGNYDFTAKQTGAYPKKALLMQGGRQRPSYRDSQLALPTRLRNRRHWKTWKKEDIDRWQTRLAADAVKVWKL